MILINEKYLNADHIQHIYITPFSDDTYRVTVEMVNTRSFFSSSGDDDLTKEMAFELRRRIVKAIVDYKSSEKPEVQHVEIPKYKEVHPKEDDGNS